MNDLEIIQHLFQLPLTVILGGVVAFLWRRLDKVQEKYEAVLIEMGKLHGKVDTEISINEKLDQIFHIMEKK
jgi:hypothetical protein